MQPERYGLSGARQTREMSNRRWMVVLAALAVAGCAGDDDGGQPAATSAPSSTTSSADLAESGPAFAVEPGTAVVEAGGERFEFVVFECLVGTDGGGPTRRLALSGSDTEPYLEADRYLSVNILVSKVVDGHEEHVIEIFSIDGSLALGAADFQTPSRGGPAPGDWIHHDTDAGVVFGSGFELRSTSADDATVLEDGVLVADCPAD
ncbi:hypothetical protein [Actinospongicola halichondriae]|uniref:hypothetical protein n=1 Tax=Actinospongicola halichondriae TaxID=3236844 RepID=UPI003D4DCCC9